MKKVIFTFFGVIFGFFLSRAGATTYDYYAGLFLFIDLQLMWVIISAAITGMIGMAILKRIRKTALSGTPLTFTGKPYQPGLIPGSLMLGMGWGMAGACPGTVLAMAGEGKLAALFTMVGIILGTYLYGIYMDAKLNKQQHVEIPSAD
jgi:hypothetical protein